jgi:membrane-associated phospholipid phosphatase
VILSVADENTERKARFLVLYLFCWLVIGNVLAILGASVGPVFYDALEGGTRFAGLHAALAQSGVTQGPVGQIQAFLWQSYAERGMAIGSGISAFPSVHVGVATLTALYLAERSRWLAPIGVAFVATILFLSVYTGYHYALDGYVSVLLVTGAWALLRRVELTAMGGLLAAPQAGRPGDRAAELTTSDTRA